MSQNPNHSQLSDSTSGSFSPLAQTSRFVPLPEGRTSNNPGTWETPKLSAAPSPKWEVSALSSGHRDAMPCTRAPSGEDLFCHTPLSGNSPLPRQTASFGRSRPPALAVFEEMQSVGPTSSGWGLQGTDATASPLQRMATMQFTSSSATYGMVSPETVAAAEAYTESPHSVAMTAAASVPQAASAPITGFPASASPCHNNQNNCYYDPSAGDTSHLDYACDPDGGCYGNISPVPAALDDDCSMDGDGSGNRSGFHTPVNVSAAHHSIPNGFHTPDAPSLRGPRHTDGYHASTTTPPRVSSGSVDSEDDGRSPGPRTPPRRENVSFQTPERSTSRPAVSRSQCAETPMRSTRRPGEEREPSLGFTARVALLSTEARLAASDMLREGSLNTSRCSRSAGAAAGPFLAPVGDFLLPNRNPFSPYRGRRGEAAVSLPAPDDGASLTLHAAITVYEQTVPQRADPCAAQMLRQRRPGSRPPTTAASSITGTNVKVSLFDCSLNESSASSDDGKQGTGAPAPFSSQPRQATALFGPASENPMMQAQQQQQRPAHQLLYNTRVPTRAARFHDPAVPPPSDNNLAGQFHSPCEWRSPTVDGISCNLSSLPQTGDSSNSKNRAHAAAVASVACKDLFVYRPHDDDERDSSPFGEAIHNCMSGGSLNLSRVTAINSGSGLLCHDVEKELFSFDDSNCSAGDNTAIHGHDSEHEAAGDSKEQATPRGTKRYSFGAEMGSRLSVYGGNFLRSADTSYQEPAEEPEDAEAPGDRFLQHHRFQYRHFVSAVSAEPFFVPLAADVNGIVWLATHRLDGMPYAVKEVLDVDRPQLTTELECLTLAGHERSPVRPLAEAYITRYYSCTRYPCAVLPQQQQQQQQQPHRDTRVHPSLPPMVPQATDVYALQTEYFPRGTVWEWVRRGAPANSQGPSFPMWSAVVCCVAQALEALHHHGIIHGAPFATNIFIVQPGEHYKLGNFGAAVRHPRKGTYPDATLPCLIGVISPNDSPFALDVRVLCRGVLLAMCAEVMSPQDFSEAFAKVAQDSPESLDQLLEDVLFDAFPENTLLQCLRRDHQSPQALLLELRMAAAAAVAPLPSETQVETPRESCLPPCLHGVDMLWASKMYDDEIARLQQVAEMLRTRQRLQQQQEKQQRQKQQQKTPRLEPGDSSPEPASSVVSPRRLDHSCATSGTTTTTPDAKEVEEHSGLLGGPAVSGSADSLSEIRPSGPVLLPPTLRNSSVGGVLRRSQGSALRGSAPSKALPVLGAPPRTRLVTVTSPGEKQQQQQQQQQQQRMPPPADLMMLSLLSGAAPPPREEIRPVAVEHATALVRRAMQNRSLDQSVSVGTCGGAIIPALLDPVLESVDCLSVSGLRGFPLQRELSQSTSLAMKRRVLRDARPPSSWE